MVTKKRRLIENAIFLILAILVIYNFGIYGYAVVAAFSVGYIVRVYTERNRCIKCRTIIGEVKTLLNSTSTELSKDLETIRTSTGELLRIIDGKGGNSDG